MLVLVPPARAQGHGPLYGLSTPTLGAGGWSVDMTTMSRVGSGNALLMLRPMLSYGLTEDVQLSASLPVPLIRPPGLAPQRMAMRMPATPDAELTLGWRFQRRATGVGSRLESTAYLGFDYPSDAARAGVRTAPAVAAGVVTGYASRVLYLWAGGLYRGSVRRAGGGDRPGDLTMLSLVVGYRPPAFQHDYPRPDWRIFAEAVGEVRGRDVAGGVPRANSGGRALFAGPTVLGLYGAWGISGGPLFPVYRQVHGAQPVERVRLAVDLIYWF